MSELFVDFQNVFLAYKDNEFAVEDIDLQTGRASSSPSSARPAAASPPS
jgi:hypothetical protein